MPASESVFCCDGVFCFDAVGPPFDVDILMRRLEIADDVRVFAEFIRIDDDLRQRHLQGVRDPLQLFIVGNGVQIKYLAQCALWNI